MGFNWLEYAGIGWNWLRWSGECCNNLEYARNGRLGGDIIKWAG